MKAAMVALALNGCLSLTWPAGAVRPDAGIVDAGDPCASIPLEMAVCGDCHEEARTIDGWSSHPSGSSPASHTWGREAFWELFTQSDSATIPEHAAPYEWAEQCFCTRSDDEPHRCLTLTGEWE